MTSLLHSLPRSRWRLDSLVEPVGPVADPVARRDARLLAAITLVLALHAAQGIFTSPLLLPAPEGVTIGHALIGVTLGDAAAYVLARTGRVRAATYLTIALVLLVPVVISLLPGPDFFGSMSTAAWMVLAILTASVLLSPAAVLTTGAGALAVLVLDGAYHRGNLNWPLSDAVVLLVCTTAIVYVYGRHRNAVEALRKKELGERNHALEQLRAELEARVEERTAELHRAATGLETAFYKLKESQSMLLQTEKMAAIGRLTAGFAHELASPLSAVLASTDALAELCGELEASIGDASVTENDFREIAHEMADCNSVADVAAKRAADFVRGLRAHTRDPGPQARERFDIAAVVRETLPLVAHAARAAKVQLTFESQGATQQLLGVPGRLSQVVTNLVGNAIDAVGENGGGNVRVALTGFERESILEISDDGVGIAEDALRQIFEPLFTTKPSGKGTGLGLAIVDEIVTQELGGRIEVASRPGAGTTFTLHLPFGGDG